MRSVRLQIRQIISPSYLPRQGAWPQAIFHAEKFYEDSTSARGRLDLARPARLQRPRSQDRHPGQSGDRRRKGPLRLGPSHSAKHPGAVQGSIQRRGNGGGPAGLCRRPQGRRDHRPPAGIRPQDQPHVAGAHAKEFKPKPRQRARPSGKRPPKKKVPCRRLPASSSKS